MALLDKNKRLVGILAGHPDDEDWPKVHRAAADALEARRQRLQSNPS